MQLRKKVCYFMIMVLSCCDLLAAVTNHPIMATIALLYMTGKLDINAEWPYHATRATNIFLALSLLALLVMNFDRYLATSYPLFHRTSVTKGRLLTLFAILVIIDVAFRVLSFNDSVISYRVYILIAFVVFSPPMLFFNYKLLLVVRKNSKDNRASPEIKKSFSLKNISSCLLAVACFVTLAIPVIVYLGLRINSKLDVLSLESLTAVVRYLATTVVAMNSSVNCLIFFWKNKVLRSEGSKVLKSMKIRRWLQSQPDQ